MDYALLKDGIVINVISLHPSNANEFPNAVPMHDLWVEIGDTYEDGVFYRNGERVLSPVEQAQTETADMQEALDYLFGGETT